MRENAYVVRVGKCSEATLMKDKSGERMEERTQIMGELEQ